MENKPVTLSGLYYKYGKKEKEVIQQHLERIKLVGAKNGQLYELGDDLMKQIKDDPRGVSPTFSQIPLSNKVVPDLQVLDTITYLVKSSSRFFLKPDIGEVFDQIHWHLLMGKDIAAIQMHPDDYQELPDTDGEHFLMKATLYK